MGNVSKYKVGTNQGGVSFKIDEDAMLDYIKECVRAIIKTHPKFKYSHETIDMTFYSRGIYVHLFGVDGAGDLYINLYWNDIDEKFELTAFDLTESVFPTDLSKEEKLDFQKYVIKTIGEEWQMTNESRS